MDRASRVVCCGSVVFDLIFEVDAIPSTPEKVAAHAFREAGGGLAATAAVAIAALGGDAEFWGRIGDDMQGRRVGEILDGLGVVPRLARSPDGRTPVSSMLVDRAGERMLAYFGGQGLDDDAAWLPLPTLESFGALLCDVRWPAGAAAALGEAGRRGVASVLDADLAPLETLEALVPLAGHTLFSGSALSRFTGDQEPKAALQAAAKRTSGTVGVTLGPRGFLWLERGRCWSQPAFRVEAVETNGAGDAFHGAFALALGRGADLAQAARFASAAAAVKCTRRGGWSAMARACDVDDLLLQQPEVAASAI